MALADYRTGFSDYQQGRLAALHILSAPVVAKYDVDISLEDRQKLEDLLTKTSKQQFASAVLFGRSDTDKANILSRLSRQLQLCVCWVDCQYLLSHYIGETEKHLARLVADAQTNQWILFFAEADALFARQSEPKDSHENHTDPHLKQVLDRILGYNGLSIFSLQQQPTLDRVRSRLSCVIHCH